MKDERLGWYYSEPVKVGLLNGQECRIVLEGYDDDPNKDEYHATISNFLASSPEVLIEVEASIYQYYQDINSYSPSVTIGSPKEIWSHIQFGNELIVSRRSSGDEGVYISLECNCAWEPEHGLQIVFRNGNKVCKIGPFDGHLTNADAFADARLEGIVYRRLK